MYTVRGSEWTLQNIYTITKKLLVQSKLRPKAFGEVDVIHLVGGTKLLYLKEGCQ